MYTSVNAYVRVTLFLFTCIAVGDIGVGEYLCTVGGVGELDNSK